MSRANTEQSFASEWKGKLESVRKIWEFLLPPPSNHTVTVKPEATQQEVDDYLETSNDLFSQSVRSFSFYGFTAELSLMLAMYIVAASRSPDTRAHCAFWSTKSTQRYQAYRKNNNRRPTTETDVTEFCLTRSTVGIEPTIRWFANTCFAARRSSCTNRRQCWNCSARFETRHPVCSACNR